MDVSAWIGIASLIIAVAAAAGTIANAIVTQRASRGAQREASGARAVAERAVAETKRIADAADAQAELLRDQLAAEEAKNAPKVRVKTMQGWVLSRSQDQTDMAIRVLVQNLSRTPDVLQQLTVGFAETVYRLPPEAPSVLCYTTDGKPLQLPLALESDKSVEVRLEFSPKMGGYVADGWEGDAAVECQFEHAERSRIGAKIRAG